MAETGIAEALRRLAEAFRAELPTRCAIIARGLDATADPDARAAMHREVHRIAGLAGSFGLDDLSNAAADADERLAGLAERQQPLDDAARNAVEAVLAAARLPS